MPARHSPLSEAWAWLIGLIAPVGGLAAALMLALGDVFATGAPAQSGGSTSALTSAGGATVIVAGASASQPPGSAPAPTVSSTSSAGTILLTTPNAMGGRAPQLQTDTSVPPDTQVAVAGVQVIGLSQGVMQQGIPPLIGQVGGYVVPIAIPATGFVVALAGFVWRVHTSPPWPPSSVRRRSLRTTSTAA